MMLSPGTMAQNADIRRPLRRAAQEGRRALRWWLDELRHLIPSRVRLALSADPMTVQILVHDNGTDVQQVRIKGLSNVERHRLEGPRDARSALVWVAKRRRRWGPLMRVDVALPARCCLIRRRKVPVAAVCGIQGFRALELERAP